MKNTAYYQSIAQAYNQVCEGSEITNRVPNASKQLSKIYGEQYGVSGRGREPDEPTEPRKTQYQRVDKKAYDADMKVWKQRSQQAVSKERLKRKGAVPVKAGKRLFEDFMKDANRASGNKTKEEIRMDKNAKQIYLAARTLDDFDRWVMFVVDML